MSTLGLLCQGCADHASVVGASSLGEAYHYAKFELGWYVDRELVFCPLCRPEPPIYSGKEDRHLSSVLVKRVHADVAAGRRIECSESDIDEVLRILDEYIVHAIDNSHYALASIAQDEETRLKDRYGR